jgi:hypothetical protein
MLLLSDLIRFAHPTLNVRIEIGWGVEAKRVSDEMRSVLLDLEESGIVVDSRKRERALQV